MVNQTRECKLLFSAVVSPGVWLLLILLVAGNTLAAETVPIDLRYLSGQPLLRAEYQTGPVDTDFTKIRTGDWRPFSPDDFNQGISGRAHWLHFTAQNPTDVAISWVIRGETSYLDNLGVYFRSGNGEFRRLDLSDQVPFNRRPLDYRTLSIPLETPAGATTEVYLQAYYDEADTLSLRFTLHQAAQFQSLKSRENLVFGMFYGAVGIMVVVALLAAVQLKQVNAIYYALFLLLSLLFWLMLNGYGFQYLWPRFPGWHNHGFHLVYLGFVITALQFSRSLLELGESFPRLAGLFTVIQIIAVAGICLRLAGLYVPVLILSFTLLGAVALLIPLASFLAWKRGLNYAFWNLLAWLLYSAGLLVGLTSASTNHLPWGMSSLTWLQAGSLLEILFLMVAMSNWVVNLEGDRKRALALANQDPLTGLGNRRLLQMAYQRYKDAFNETSPSLYIIVFDLDHFKRINDEYGHEAGDTVLQNFGALLRQTCRAQDVAVRFGGEEFALLLPLDSMEEACRVAERIRIRFAAEPTIYGDQEIEHTLSCGAAEVMSRYVQLDVDAMMRCADEALYKAKEAGRNLSYIYRPQI